MRTGALNEQVAGRHRRWTFAVNGAVAGVVATLAFTWAHQVLISDIWSFIGPMLMAGALCGLCIASTFSLLVRAPTVRTWAWYNATYVGLLVVLGVLSLIVYQPVTTIEDLLLLDEPPDFLFAQAMPVTIGFGIGSAVVITILFGRRWWQVLPAAISMTVVIALLGLNISVLGLVELPVSALYVLVELAVLIIVLVAVFAAAVVALEWRTFRPRKDLEVAP